MSHDPMFDCDVPEDCLECGEPLHECNDSGFCSDEHLAVWGERQRAADNAYAVALMEEAKHAAEWKEEQRRERERERGLPAAEFEIPGRLKPSTAMGLAMTRHYMTTPAKERV